MKSHSTRLLKRALIADGVVSGLSGALLVALPGTIASFLGVRSPGGVAVLGASLVVYAAGLLHSARREAPHRGEAALAVGLNLAWVAGSLAVVAAGWLSTAGNWAVALVADVVLIFAILQAVGLRRMGPDPVSWAA